MPSVMHTTSGSSGIRRFHDRVRGERRRNENDGSIRAGLSHGSLDSVEYGQIEVLGAAFAGRDAADDVGAVRDRLLGMEGAFLAGEALHEQPCVLLTSTLIVASATTTFSAASFMPSAMVKFSAGFRQNLLARVPRWCLPSARRSGP